MLTATTRVVLDSLGFPEAPRWRDGELWFSDLQERVVRCFDPRTGIAREVAQVSGVPSGLGWDAQGRLLVVSMWDGHVLRLYGDDPVPAADLTGLAAPPWNDMVVDHSGRAYVGNVGFDFAGGDRRGTVVRGERARATVLAMMDADGSVRAVADDLLCPNGAVLTTGGQTLIVAETLRRRLTAFDVAPDGALSRRRTWAELGTAKPDGIACDADGACWVAAVGSPRVVRVTEGGTITDEVIASQPAIACALGGDTLYVCTAPGSSRDNVGRRAGRIESALVDAAGATE